MWRSAYLTDGTKNSQRSASPVNSSKTRRQKRKKEIVLKCGTAMIKSFIGPTFVDMPPICHLKTRLIQPLPLRAAQRKKTAGKQLCTDVIRAGEFKKKKKSKKRIIYSTHFSVCSYWKQHNTSLICFPADISDELTSNLTFLFFLIFILERCVLVLQPCISVLAYPLGFYFYLIFKTL